MIPVVLADDHAVVREGLRELLDGVEDVEVVAVASNGREAQEAVARHRPAIVLMDLEMPVVDGIAATRQIVAESPGCRVVVLTSFADRERILDALDAGACGYLLKDAEPEELVRGIRAAARGESPLAPRAATEILRARSARRLDKSLTEREREVLLLLADGLQNKQIALQLAISEKTVKAHLGHIFDAIGARDRTQAALWAERNRERLGPGGHRRARPG